MNYQSLSFILFTALVLLIYYVVGHKRKIQLWILAIANITFYIFNGMQYLPFLLVTMLTTYSTGLVIGKVYQKADDLITQCDDIAEKKSIRGAAKKRAKKVLLIALFISIGLLVVCKYTNFFISNLNQFISILGIPNIKMFNIILPLGISFYTFMAISYVLDIYWKRYKAEKNFLLYAVYLSYFPHVLQGPIDRFNEFKEQLKDKISFNYKNFTFGSQLAIWGFFKKLVIADRLGLFVNTVLDNYANFDGLFSIIAIAVYSIQIYADFSGCIDIVTGISEMFGINLKKNFNHPYFARTMAEFWRRWHISLQEWFKDYVYFPVSASKFTKSIRKSLKNKGFERTEKLFTSCFPILVVWITTGLWHGAAWQYVVWGIFHATLLIGSQILEPFFKWLTKLFHTDTENFGWHFWQMCRTFFLCCVGRIFFRAKSLVGAIAIIKNILSNTSFVSIFDCKLSSLGLTSPDLLVAIISLFVLLLVDILQEKMSIRETLAKQNIVFRWIIIFAGLYSVIIFGIYGPEYDASKFIYEQF